jgi:methionyl aminopeptidase
MPTSGFIKSQEEIAKIRQAGKILAQVAKAILARAEEGARLRELDALARELITKPGGRPAFLGYRPYGARKPYPCTVCTSVNEAIVHGVPNNYKLKSGDILKLDFGVVYDGWNADAAWTVGIGSIGPEARKLIKVTEKALFEAIKQANPGNCLGDIGWVVSHTAIKYGFRVVEGLTGHGIGQELHEDPSVFNEGQKGSGMRLEPGMVLAIEPMISAGSSRIVQRKDDSYTIADGSLSAHCEHTVAITENGPEILTK